MDSIGDLMQSVKWIVVLACYRLCWCGRIKKIVPDRKFGKIIFYDHFYLFTKLHKKNLKPNTEVRKRKWKWRKHTMTSQFIGASKVYRCYQWFQQAKFKRKHWFQVKAGTPNHDCWNESGIQLLRLSNVISINPRKKYSTRTSVI